MSRSGYVDDWDDNNSINLYRGTVTRALRGKRGQAFLLEMLLALDAMPVKELVAEAIVRDSEHVCAMGAVAVARRLDVSAIDMEDGGEVGAVFGIARAMACEIAYENDECGRPKETPAERWTRMRAWVASEIRTEAPPPAEAAP